MPCTEVAVLPLKPGSEIGNPHHEAAEVFADCGADIVRAPGAQEMRFGTWVESPDMLQLFIDWEEKKNHDEFMASDEYTPFLKRFQSIMSGGPQLTHVDFEPAGKLRTVLSAPVTEVATFYFDDAPPADYLDGVSTFFQRAHEAKVDGFTDATFGITYEVVERDGVKGKAAVILIGWTSVDAHMKFRETQGFKDSIHLLRSNMKTAEVHHVACLDFRGSQ